MTKPKKQEEDDTLETTDSSVEKPKPTTPQIPTQKPKAPTFQNANNFGKWRFRNTISKQRPGRAAARGR